MGVHLSDKSIGITRRNINRKTNKFNGGGRGRGVEEGKQKDICKNIKTYLKKINIPESKLSKS